MPGPMVSHQGEQWDKEEGDPGKANDVLIQITGEIKATFGTSDLEKMQGRQL